MPRNIITSGGNGRLITKTKFSLLPVPPAFLCTDLGGNFSGTYTKQSGSVPTSGPSGGGDIWYQNTNGAVIRGNWYQPGIWNLYIPNGPVFFQSSSVGPYVFPSDPWSGPYGPATITQGSC
jgi:hypothetical protein